MSDIWFSLFLFSTALFHTWIQIYNRVLLCMDDSPIKIPTHFASFIFLALVPSIAMFSFRESEMMQRILSWNPQALDEWILFVLFFILSMIMLWRLGLAITEILVPNKSHRVLQEVHRSVPVEKHSSKLPIFLQDQDTTWDIEFRDVDIQVRHLPAEFDGLSIILASDLHYESDPKVASWLSEIREYVNALKPDVIVFSGDYVNKKKDARKAMEFHGGFKARVAKLGVLGNHDYWTRPGLIKKMASRNGIKLISEDRFELEREGRKIVFCGTDSPWNHDSVPWDKITSGHETDCLIMISHTPDNAFKASDHDVNLILSGHNHGGQIRLPGIGAIAVPSKFGRKFSEGIFDLHESCAMVVSRGVGCSRVGGFGFLRMNCRPEIIRLNLRAPMQDIPVRVESDLENMMKLKETDSQTIVEPAFKTASKH